jgi:SAM-dependent MidA family methyltransferase
MISNSTRFSNQKADLLYSQRLTEFLRNEINQKGPISFIRFMEHVLYMPHLGYYMGGQKKFGKEGDFITAPELTPIFSQCIARQCEQVLAHCPGSILECGAGTGQMAIEILKALEASQKLPDFYYIFEISPNLKQRQQRNLYTEIPHLFERIKWLETLDNFQMQGIVLGNEILDALPVHRFKYAKGQIQESFVALQHDEFCIHWLDADQELARKVSALGIDFQGGYESEYNPFINVLLKKLSDTLAKGAILFMDYGFPRHEFYHPDRNKGTLMCHYRHLAHTDPLKFIGLQDITSHVDFTLVAEAALENLLSVAGFTNQAGFLLSCDLTGLLEKQHKDNYLEISNKVKILTSPNEMGELFKVIALIKDLAIPLLGFTAWNYLERL